MKMIVITICIALTLLTGSVYSQNATFEKALADAIVRIDSAKTTAQLQETSQLLHRIALAENRWEPYYHHAFSLILLSYRGDDGDARDLILDKAQQSIDKANELNGDKSELLAIQAWLYQARISISPMRGMTYSRKAAATLSEAITVNPDNPRAHYLLGMNIYHTPKMFGGGKHNALGEFVKAQKLFDALRKPNPIMPHWGARSNKKMLQRCKE